MEYREITLPRGVGFVVGDFVYVKSYVFRDGGFAIRCRSYKTCSARGKILNDGKLSIFKTFNAL